MVGVLWVVGDMIADGFGTGETWNLMKIGYQLKQVRERLAKGLVDKGILRTEKRNFLLFDMATHPVVDSGAKDEIRRRVRNVLTSRTVVLPPSQFLPEEAEFRYFRTLAMVSHDRPKDETLFASPSRTFGHVNVGVMIVYMLSMSSPALQWSQWFRMPSSTLVGPKIGLEDSTLLRKWDLTLQ